LKTGLSILCIAHGARPMEAFLTGLAAGEETGGSAVPLEVIMAGKAEELPFSLAAALRERGIAARFLEPCCEAAYTYQDWVHAITAAQADWILHADENTRFLSASGLSRNLEILRDAPKDILHFKAPHADTPSPADLRGTEILSFFLKQGFGFLAIANKIYARSLCLKTCRELDRAGRAGDMAEAVFLHLFPAALADTYSGQGLGVTECRIPPRTVEDHAREAAALYRALEFFPEYFARLGHPEEIVRLARYRLRAEFALSLGRVCRSPNVADVAGVADIEANDAARRVLLRFFSKADLLNALLLGTARNAEKVVEVYRVIYEDTVFDPCSAYGIQKYPLPQPGGQAGSPDG